MKKFRAINEAFYSDDIEKAIIEELDNIGEDEELEITQIKFAVAKKEARSQGNGRRIICRRNKKGQLVCRRV